MPADAGAAAAAEGEERALHGPEVLGRRDRVLVGLREPALGLEGVRVREQGRVAVHDPGVDPDDGARREVVGGVRQGQTGVGHEAVQGHGDAGTEAQGLFHRGLEVFEVEGLVVFDWVGEGARGVGGVDFLHQLGVGAGVLEEVVEQAAQRAACCVGARVPGLRLLAGLRTTLFAGEKRDLQICDQVGHQLAIAYDVFVLLLSFTEEIEKVSSILCRG